MPIAATDLVLTGAASRPEDDVSTSGGAQDALARPLDTQLTADSVIAVQSDNAGDTQNLTVTGRDAAGGIVSEVITLTGVTEAVGAVTFERILKLVLSAAATGTITVKQGAGGATRHTFNPAETDAFIFFQRSASDPSVQEIHYEAGFWENQHATLTLNDAEVELTADPDTTIRIGLAVAKDDATSVANRLTAPGGVTFVDDGVAQAVPGNELLASEAIKMWVEMDRAAGAPAIRTTFTSQLAGTSV